MSQTMSPIEWLKSALYLLGVWDIFMQTTSEVVNDEGGGRVILPLTSLLGIDKSSAQT
jgi:hypothetical protein